MVLEGRHTGDPDERTGMDHHTKIPTRLRTKTDTLRRLREGAALVREQRHYPKNWMIEVGTRKIPTYIDREPDFGTWNVFEFDEDGVPQDDLDSFWSLSDAASLDEVRGNGYYAHLYFTSTPLMYGELVDVVVVWLGNDDHRPQIVSR